MKTLRECCVRMHFNFKTLLNVNFYTVIAVKAMDKLTVLLVEFTFKISLQNQLKLLKVRH